MNQNSSKNLIPLKPLKAEARKAKTKQCMTNFTGLGSRLGELLLVGLTELRRRPAMAVTSAAIAKARTVSIDHVQTAPEEVAS